MRILLAGAGGFIGSHLARRLSAEGHEVVPLVRPDRGVFDPDRFPDGIDAAVNAAGRLGGPGVGPDELAAANTALPAAMAGICAERGIPLVHLSTPGVAGLLGGSREDSPQAPWGAYEESKAAAERLLPGLMPERLLTVLRPDFVYGPGDRHKLSFFRQVGRGWFPLVGGGGALLRPTFVIDVCRAVRESLGGGLIGPGTWNIGGPEVVSVRGFAGAAAGVMGVRLLRIPVPAFLFRAALLLGPLAPPQLSRSRLALFGRDHWVDVSKASAAGFAPATSLADGLAATVAWYRDEGLIR